MMMMSRGSLAMMMRMSTMAMMRMSKGSLAKDLASSHGSGEQSQCGITLKRQLKGPNTVLLLTSELLYKPSDGSPTTFHSQSTKSKV